MFSRQTLLSDKMGFEDHLTDDIVLMHGQGVLAGYEIMGVYPGTADDPDIASWFQQLHAAWKSLAAPDIELMVYQCRGVAGRDGYQSGPHKHRLAIDLSAAYEDGLWRKALFQVAIYFTVHIKGGPLRELDLRQARLTEACALLENQIRVFGPRRLGYIKRGRGLYDEIAEAVAFAVTGVFRWIPATTGRMSVGMITDDIRFRLGFRQSYIEFHPPHGTDTAHTRYAALFAMFNYPVETWPGMFAGVAKAPYTNTLVQSFSFHDDSKAVDLLNRKQNKQLIAGDKAIHQTAKLTEAMSELMDKRWVLGDHSLVLIAFAGSKMGLAEVASKAANDLAGGGLRVSRQRISLRPAYLSLFPGNERYRPRPGHVKSGNFVSFAPFYKTPTGAMQGHWGGPIDTLRTLDGQAFYFHWHLFGAGNALVTGMTGSGKTFTTGKLLAMTCGRARVFAFDYKRGWRKLFHELDADYAELQPGRPSMAPLKVYENTPTNLEHLNDLARSMASGVWTEEEGRRLAVGLRCVMGLPRRLRNWWVVRGHLDGTPEGAGARLQKWCWGEELGWALDGPTDSIPMNDLSAADITHIMQHHRVRGPMMADLFHRLALMAMTGEPISVFFDEGWEILNIEIIAAMVERSVRTIRSKNGHVVFITQQPNEIAASKIGLTLVQQSVTHLHFANPKARKRDYIDIFGLTEGAWDAFRLLQPQQGFLLGQGGRWVVVSMPMDGPAAKFIPVLSASEVSLRVFDAEQAEQVMEAAE